MSNKIAAIIKVIAFFGLWGGLLVFTNHYYSTIPEFFAQAPALIELWTRIWPFLIVMFLTLLFAFLLDKKVEVRVFTDRVDRDMLAGLVFGAVWIGGTFGLLYMTDTIVVAGPETVTDGIFWVITVLLAVFTHEFLFRGYVFSLLEEEFSGMAAVIVTACIPLLLSPGALAGGVVALLTLFAEGIMLGMLRVYTGGMLAPFLTYLIWSQIGTIVFGTVPLGIHAPTLWTTALTGIEFVTGGSQMFSGSIIGLFVLIILIDLGAILMSDKKELEQKSIFFRRRAK